MIILENFSNDFFTLNGVNFAKIYQPLKQGSSAIGIYNVNDTSQQLVSSTNFSEFEVDGVVYSSQSEAIAAILEVVYSSDVSKLTLQVEGKTDKGGYSGTTQDLKNEVDSKAFEGLVSYQTKTALLAVDPLPGEGTPAKVVNDATASNNGYYSVSGGVWVKDEGLTFGEINARLSFASEAVAEAYYSGLTAQQQADINLREFIIEAGVNAGVNKFDSNEVNGLKFIRKQVEGVVQIWSDSSTFNSSLSLDEMSKLIRAVSIEGVDPVQDYVLGGVWNGADSGGSPLWHVHFKSVQALASGDQSAHFRLNSSAVPSDGVNVYELEDVKNIGVTIKVAVDFSVIAAGSKFVPATDAYILDNNEVWNRAFAAHSVSEYEASVSTLGGVDVADELTAVNSLAVAKYQSPFAATATLEEEKISKAGLLKGIKALSLKGNRVAGKDYYLSAIWNAYVYPPNPNGEEYHIQIREADTDAVVGRFLTSEVQPQDGTVVVRTLSEMNGKGITGTIAIDFSQFVFNDATLMTPEATILDSKVWEEKARQDVLSYASQAEETGVVKFDGYSLGNIDFEDEFSTDYIDIVSYGQSLSVGAKGHLDLTTVAYPDTFMLGNNPFALAEYGQNGSEVLTPLTSVSYSWFAEPPVIAALGSFKKMFDRYHRSGYQKKFIGVAAGKGGQSIESLSKECTDTLSGTTEDNYYNLGFTRHLNQAKNTIAALGKTISCPAIFFMQGESNYSGTGQGLTSGTDRTLDKDVYKDLLLQLKNNMQADVVAKYNQTKKPLFFIYQTGASWIKNKPQLITQAQIEFAAENEDVVLMNPIYQNPKVADNHLTANGSRMYGESIAKTLFNVFVQNKVNTSVEAKKITISGNVIEIDYSVPVAPLVFDTNTLPKVTDFGFLVYNNNAAVSISDIQIKGGTRVVITCATSLTGEVEVTYAGHERGGSGNLRDSDEWKGRTVYEDDSASPDQPTYIAKDEDGVSLLGQKYPVYNFANHLFHRVNI